MISLFIATPMFGGQCSGIFTDSMIRLYDSLGRSMFTLQHQFRFNGSLIPVLRTDLANEFMSSGFEYLLFIDADIGFSRDDVLGLISAQQQSNFDVVGGIYRRKTTARIDYAVWPVPDWNKDWIEVEYIGAGFMLIPRSTLQRMTQEFPELRYANETKTRFFGADLHEDKYWSEDAMFCSLVRKMGGRIGCCPKVKLRHFGSHVFSDENGG